MVRIIISNKVCWGNAETETAIALVVAFSIFADLLLGTQPFKTMKLVYFIKQDNTSYNSIYIYAPSFPMSAST